MIFSHNPIVFGIAAPGESFLLLGDGLSRLLLGDGSSFLTLG